MFIKWVKCGHCGVHSGDKAWHDGCPEQEHRAQRDVSFPHALQLLQWSLGPKCTWCLLQERVSLQQNLDTVRTGFICSEPKSISYGLSPEQAAVISWERASFKYPFKSFKTSRERLPWNSLRGKRNAGITKETNKHTCLNKNLRTIRFHAVVSHLFRCENI